MWFIEKHDCNVEIHFSAFLIKFGQSEMNSTICKDSKEIIAEIPVIVISSAIVMDRDLGIPLFSSLIQMGSSKKAKIKAKDNKIKKSFIHCIPNMIRQMEINTEASRTEYGKFVGIVLFKNYFSKVELKN